MSIIAVHFLRLFVLFIVLLPNWNNVFRQVIGEGVVACLEVRLAQKISKK